ncbi:HNH endonuclease signature motif containing protein [Vibrio sp. 10N.222.51.C12]|uniref:HNH endonuclease signature motif containing protein n=1 Tax=Vibrio sp. 10N.222.51.C12 TaxID=3229622 RepID=UPI00354B1341
MAEDRPAIPEPIKREVRQQCCFGCAICGMPFFQYDHIDEYADVQEHTADNLVLLCPNHHSAKTTKKLSKERIRAAKQKPFNSTRPHTSGFQVEPTQELLTLLGSNLVKGWYPNGNGDHHPVWINGKSYFTIHSDEGWLSVSLAVTNDRGEILLTVVRGELMVATGNWDYVYEGDNIKVRAGLGDIILDINLSDSKVEILKGMFLDRTIDGYVIQDGALHTICEGQNGGISIGCTANANGFGGWGILNQKAFPDVQAPGGFGFFRSF